MIFTLSTVQSFSAAAAAALASGASTMINSTFLPRSPPFPLISSRATSEPSRLYFPKSAMGPLSGWITPILMPWASAGPASRKRRAANKATFVTQLFFISSPPSSRFLTSLET